MGVHFGRCLCARALSSCVLTRDLMPGRGVAAPHEPVPSKCRHATVLVENAPEEERGGSLIAAPGYITGRQ